MARGTVDFGTQFCERCGRDRDSLAGRRGTYRDCPACGAACCPDCWNLVDGACLACAPFRLHESTARPRIVFAPTAPSGATARDPYADLRVRRPGAPVTPDPAAAGRHRGGLRRFGLGARHTRAQDGYGSS